MTTAPNVDEGAERALLGAALRSSSAYDACATLVSAADFYNPAHEVIWDAIAYLSSQGTAEAPMRADPTLVVAHLQHEGKLDAAGGAPYLHTLLAQVVTPANAVYYAALVANAAHNRAVELLGTRLQQAGRTPMTAAERDALVAETLPVIEGLCGDSATRTGLAYVGADIDATLDWLDGGNGDPGVTTGLTDLDALLGGLTGGQVIVIGARPGIGKTVIAQHMAQAVAKTGRTVVAFSLEMSREELQRRVLGELASVNSRSMKAGALTDADWNRLAGAVNDLAAMPLLINDDPDLTPARLNALVAQAKRKHPDLALVTVDYLQLMEAGAPANSRQEAVAYISRELKKIAKRHNVPIVVLSQLNRSSTQRSDNRPQISDLRESGAVEQDADVVILLHRDDAYQAESPRAGEMDLIVAKHRNGETGTVVVAAQLHYFRLADLAHRSDRRLEAVA